MSNQTASEENTMSSATSRTHRQAANNARRAARADARHDTAERTRLRREAVVTYAWCSARQWDRLVAAADAITDAE